MKILVFDVGGTEIKYSVMEKDGRVCTQGVRPTPMEDQQTFLQALHEVYLANQEDVEGIAVSMPGMIDSDHGICRTGGALVYNAGQPVARQLSELCGCPVHIDNDGKCAAWAEYTVGSLQGCTNAAVFVIGTGVGGGLILGGQLMRGKHFSAGEFSYLSADSSAWGQLSGLVAVQCSTQGLLGMMRAAKGIPELTPFNGKDAFALVNAGDPQAVQVLEAFARNVAIQIYNLQMLLDVEKVAIGGGISRQPALLEAIRRQLGEVFATLAVPGGAVQTVEVVRCAYGNEANQIGALQSYLTWRGAQG